jgi:3-oxoacyl-[acyl-carrier-protein] synthase II
MAVKVVVTGLGTVTPIGTDLPTTWGRLIAGEDGAAPVGLFDVSGCRCKIAGTATLPALPHVGAKKLKRLSRSNRLALPAARDALRDADLVNADGRSTLAQLPISVSTTGGGMSLGEQFMRALVTHKRTPNYFLISHYSAQRQMLDLQDDLGLRGPITIIANACASGANAIGHARDLIRAGVADCVLAGGYEALTELIYVGFDCLQAMSTDRCRPFDTQRSGLMLGEAGAFMVLESEAHARRRGARILCELAGYGHSTDPHHLTQPNPRGVALVQAARMAFDDAGFQPADIGYLNAHGTATLLNDASECAAFAGTFNGAWPRISSTKAAIGHTLGAAGSVEAVFAVQALVTGELPPQINLRQPEPAVAGKLVAPGERDDRMRAAMSVNLGFGGSNAALIFTRHES